MQIKVKNMVPPAFEGQITMTSGATVADLMVRLKLQEQYEYLILVNGKNRLPDYRLQAEDQVTVFYNVSGG